MRERERETLFSFFVSNPFPRCLLVPKGYYIPAVALSPPGPAVLPMEASIVAEAKSDEISAISVSSK